MPTIPARLATGFAAGFVAHVALQGALGTALHAAQLAPALPWSLEPVPPLGVPATLNLGFWDGLWGMAYALAEPRLTKRLGWWGGGLALGAASLAIYWFLVLPLKGAGIGGGFPPGMVALSLAYDTVFGLGTAALYRLSRWRPSVPALAARND